MNSEQSLVQYSVVSQTDITSSVRLCTYLSISSCYIVMCRCVRHTVSKKHITSHKLIPVAALLLSPPPTVCLQLQLLANKIASHCNCVTIDTSY